MKNSIVILATLISSFVFAQPTKVTKQDKKAAKAYIRTRVSGENSNARIKHVTRPLDEVQKELAAKGINSKLIYHLFSSDTLSEKTLVWRQETQTIGGKSKPFVYYHVSRSDSSSILSVLTGN